MWRVSFLTVCQYNNILASFWQVVGKPVLKNLMLKPNVLSLCKNRTCGTLSNALEISENMIYFCTVKIIANDVIIYLLAEIVLIIFS